MKKNNRAVMSERKSSKAELDIFPTPPWATRALCEWLKLTGHYLNNVLEPAAGYGHMAKPLREYFDVVHSSDIYPHTPHLERVADYLNEDFPIPQWTITNPPFKLAEEFYLRAAERSFDGCAMLVRTSFLEGRGRYERLFSVRPPTDVLQFVERVPMAKDRLDPKLSTATSYCWLVHRKSISPSHTRLHWIPPCRKALERPKDYL
jgi:hypothetical protein